MKRLLVLLLILILGLMINIPVMADPGGDGEPDSGFTGSMSIYADSIAVPSDDVSM